MASKDQELSDESDAGLDPADYSKGSETQPSSYFVTEFNVKKHDNQGKQKIVEQTTSGRKVYVNVSSHGIEKKTEISISSNFTKKKDCGTQSDRSIVGQEGSPPKERKKWVRPPVVGQAANMDLPGSGQTHTSSDSEIEKKKTQKFHLSIGKSTSYFDSKINYGEEIIDFQSKDITPLTPENTECPRVPSPGSVSSLTSRPLEWDSGADVGYTNFSNVNSDQRISTIEKLALAQGTAIIFKRSDPEGTTGNTLPNPAIKIAPPVAESTPKFDCKSDSDSELPGKMKEKNLHPLFPEVIVKNVGEISDSSVSPDLPRRTESNVQHNENIKKISASLEEMGLDDKKEFVRSNSQNNIEENVKPLRIDSAKSRSSSSVSTVVNKKNSQSSIYRPQQYETNSDDNNERLKTQHDNLSRQPSPQGTDQFNTLDSNQLTGEARVNSFEYLPGHVYENSVNKIDSDSSSQQGDEVWEDLGGNTLKDDVERGAYLMAEFIRNSKAGDDTALKRQLVRRVVEKLINFEYADDDSAQADNMMIETRGQISGESSTEKSHQLDGHDTPSKSNKCVGTGVSTSLSGYTESSEWNTDSVADSSKKSSSDCYGSHYSGRKSKKVDKFIQTSIKSQRGSKIIHHSEKKEALKSKDGLKSKRQTEKEMIQYLQKERKNQLFWIKSEIDHLSNLKALLEKHEALKKNLEHLKRNRQSLEEPLKNYSHQVEKHRKSRLKREKREIKSAFAYKSDEAKTKSNHSGSSSQKDTDWASHHYETDDDVRVRKENMEPMITAVRRKQSDSQILPRSTSYTIVFPNKSEIDTRRKTRDVEDDVMLSVGELKSAINKIVERHRTPSVIPDIHQPTLRECLEKVRPDYIKNAEGRRQILSEIVDLRQQREENKQEIIAAVHADQPGPPAPLAVKRVFSQKNLRKQTERKYKQLAEVRSKKAEIKRKEQYKTNKLMAEVFNRRLQRRTLQGQVNLSNSVCVTDPPK